MEFECIMFGRIKYKFEYKFEGIMFGTVKYLTRGGEDIYIPPRTTNEVMMTIFQYLLS